MKKHGIFSQKLQLKILFDFSDRKLHSRYEMNVTNITVFQVLMSLFLVFLDKFVFTWTVFTPLSKFK
jgi:hypothetical protein